MTIKYPTTSGFSATSAASAYLDAGIDSSPATNEGCVCTDGATPDKETCS